MQTRAKLLAAGLSGGRLAIGAGIWLAPEPTARAMGFRRRLSGAGLALGRLAATRDLVLGAWQLSALGDPVAFRRASIAGAVADAGDAVAFGLAVAEGDEREAGIKGTVAALAATALGVWLSTHKSK
jgi:hypothetical protein